MLEFADQRAVNIRDVYTQDLSRAKQISEDHIRNIAYQFAIRLADPISQDELVKAVNDLTLEVRAFKQFDDAFETVMNELKGDI